MAKDINIINESKWYVVRKDDGVIKEIYKEYKTKASAVKYQKKLYFMDFAIMTGKEIADITRAKMEGIKLSFYSWCLVTKGVLEKDLHTIYKLIGLKSRYDEDYQEGEESIEGYVDNDYDTWGDYIEGRYGLEVNYIPPPYLIFENDN